MIFVTVMVVDLSPGRPYWPSWLTCRADMTEHHSVTILSFLVRRLSIPSHSHSLIYISVPSGPKYYFPRLEYLPNHLQWMIYKCVQLINSMTCKTVHQLVEYKYHAFFSIRTATLFIFIMFYWIVILCCCWCAGVLCTPIGAFWPKRDIIKNLNLYHSAIQVQYHYPWISSSLTTPNGWYIRTPPRLGAGTDAVLAPPRIYQVPGSFWD